MAAFGEAVVDPPRPMQAASCPIGVHSLGRRAVRVEATATRTACVSDRGGRQPEEEREHSGAGCEPPHLRATSSGHLELRQAHGTLLPLLTVAGAAYSARSMKRDGTIGTAVT